MEILQPYWLPSVSFSIAGARIYAFRGAIYQRIKPAWCVGRSSCHCSIPKCREKAVGQDKPCRKVPLCRQDYIAKPNRISESKPAGDNVHTNDSLGLTAATERTLF
ncbi:hypothetical protein FKM82_002454 [Ascaphus truei]